MLEIPGFKSPYFMDKLPNIPHAFGALNLSGILYTEDSQSYAGRVVLLFKAVIRSNITYCKTMAFSFKLRYGHS